MDLHRESFYNRNVSERVSRYECIGNFFIIENVYNRNIFKEVVAIHIIWKSLYEGNALEQSFTTEEY